MNDKDIDIIKKMRCTDLKLHNFPDTNPESICCWCGITVEDAISVAREKMIVKGMNKIFYDLWNKQKG